MTRQHVRDVRPSRDAAELPDSSASPFLAPRSPGTGRSPDRPPTTVRVLRVLGLGLTAALAAILLTQTSIGNSVVDIGPEGPEQLPDIGLGRVEDETQMTVVLEAFEESERRGLRERLTGYMSRFGRGEEIGPLPDYQANLDMIQAATVRNTNHDNSPYLNTASADLNPENHYGPRQEYLNNPAGNPEQAFPIPNGGQFRVACEFSHFAYDDPLLFPNKPGAAHLHMFFGNTHANAFTSYESLVNTGSSTCNGQELNRTGYWAPAVFDGNGNVRIPERIVIYYKGEGKSRGASQVYPDGAAMITHDVNSLPGGSGGSPGKLNYSCTDNYSSPSGDGSQTMASCDGSRFGSGGDRRVVLEVNIKFPQCWNGQDPANWQNFQVPTAGSWYGSDCRGDFGTNLPNLEYFVNYVVEPGENTSNWFISSDVDPESLELEVAAGSSIHGDWWGGWHKETNQTWIDNCVNYADGAASGCGFGYLTNGGPNGNSPYDGPALKVRPQYTGPIKVPAEQLLQELCPDPNKAYTKREDAAYCAPGSGLSAG